MKTLFNILIFLFLILLSSIGSEKPLPEKIQLNEMCTWDRKHGTIELQEGWLQMNRDSLLKDAGMKIQNIKLNN
jgi:hypothetical protein